MYYMYCCRVLYFSIHRYDHGNFWPNLRESGFDFIGCEEGKGFNINVPINQVSTHYILGSFKDYCVENRC